MLPPSVVRVSPLVLTRQDYGVIALKGRQQINAIRVFFRVDLCFDAVKQKVNLSGIQEYSYLRLQFWIFYTFGEHLIAMKRVQHPDCIFRSGIFT